MTTVYLPVEFDKVLKMWSLEVVIDGENETLVYDTKEEAEAQANAFMLVKGNQAVFTQTKGKEKK